VEVEVVVMDKIQVHLEVQVEVVLVILVVQVILLLQVPHKETMVAVDQVLVLLIMEAVAGAV
jgi:hypothetical protein